jgi:hypothetical protein
MKHLLIVLLLVFFANVHAQEGSEPTEEPEIPSEMQTQPVPGIQGQDDTQVGDEEVKGKAQLEIEDASKPAFDLQPELFAPIDSIMNEREQVLNQRTLVVIDSFIDSSVELESPYLRIPTQENVLNREITIHVLDPNRDKIKNWQVDVCNAQGEILRSYSGKGKPPRELPWDGTDEQGSEIVTPGEPYNYILTIYGDEDQRLRLAGDPFKVDGFRYDHENDLRLLMTTDILFVTRTHEFTPDAEERMQEILNLAKLHYDRGIDIEVYCTDGLRSEMWGEEMQEYIESHMELANEVVQVTPKFFAGGPKYERVEITIR